MALYPPTGLSTSAMDMGHGLMSFTETMVSLVRARCSSASAARNRSAWRLAAPSCRTRSPAVNSTSTVPAVPGGVGHIDRGKWSFPPGYPARMVAGGWI